MGMYEINVAQSMAAERSAMLARDAELRRYELERPSDPGIQPIRIGIGTRLTDYFHALGWHLPHLFGGRPALR